MYRHRSQVFDGHGGSYAAEFVRDAVLTKILGQECFQHDVEEALVRRIAVRKLANSSPLRLRLFAC